MLAALAACLAGALWLVLRDGPAEDPAARAHGAAAESAAAPSGPGVVTAPDLGPGSAPDAGVPPERRGAESDLAAPAPAGAEGSAACIAGRVLDEQGLALAGARVLLLREWSGLFALRSPLGIEAVSDGNGAFLLEDVPAGVPLAVEASARGRARRAAGPLIASPGALTELPDLVLGPGLALHGVVRSDPDLSPLPGATVTVHEESRAAGTARIQGRGRDQLVTDGLGRFTVEGLDYTEYRFVVEAPGHAPEEILRTFLLARGRSEMEMSVQLRRSVATARGVVRERDGGPIPGAALSATLRPVAPGAHRLAAVSGADGSFEIAGLVEGAEYEVAAAAAGFHLAEPAVARGGGAPLEVILERNGGIRGRVATAGGAAPPAFAASVLLSAGAGLAPRLVKSAACGEQGSFFASDLAPGRYVLEVTAPGAALTATAEIEVSAGEVVTGVEVRLAAGGSIRGRAMTGDSQPLAGAAVTLAPANLDPTAPLAEVLRLEPLQGKSCVTGADGVFLLEHVAAGQYGVRIDALDGGMVLLPEVEVKEEGGTDLGPVLLRRGGALAGNALGPDGAPLALAQVVAASAEAGFRQSALTDGRGAFRFDRLPAGAYRVTIQPRDAWDSFRYDCAAEAVVPEGGSATVTVRMRERTR